MKTYEQWLEKFPDIKYTSKGYVGSAAGTEYIAQAEQLAFIEGTLDQLEAYHRWRIRTLQNEYAQSHPEGSVSVDPYYLNPDNKPVFPNPTIPPVIKTRAQLEAELVEVRKEYPNAKLTPFGIVKGKLGAPPVDNVVEARLAKLEKDMADVIEFIKMVKELL